MKMHEIKSNDNSQWNILHQSVSNKIKEFKARFKEWNEEDFIIWIEYIEGN